MQSRRDQVAAQSYLLSRLTSALMRAEPDAVEAPSKRDTRALITSALIGVIILAAIVVVTILRPNAPSKWQQPDRLIVDKDSGSRFLFMDGQLRPVRNVASARLVLGKVPETVLVDGSALRGVPRGAAVGQAGQPDSLPTKQLLNAGSWLVCAVSSSGTASTASHPSGTTIDTSVEVGAPGVLPAGDTGLLVRQGSTSYLIWHATRFKITDPAVADVLGLSDRDPSPVSASWLGLTVAGPDLQADPVPEQGHPAGTVADRPAQIGDLFQSGTGHFVLRTDGLAPLTPLQFLLASTQAATDAPRTISAFQLGHARRSTYRLPPDPRPASMPSLTTTPAGLQACLQYAPNSASAAPSLGFAPPAPATTQVGSVAISVPPGGGALVAATKPTDQAMPGVRLVTDDGQAASVGDQKALQALGYSTSQVAVLPAALPALLPQGAPLIEP